MDLFGEPDPPAQSNEEETQEVLESDPEGDRSLGHPRTNDALLGHHETEKHFIDCFQAGRVPHGILLNGPKGIGKATLAYRLARYLLKHGVNDPNQSALFDAPPVDPSQDLYVSSEDNAFRLVASGGHPDLLTLERKYDAAKNEYKDNIAVAEVRKVNPFLRMTASYGGWRVVIVDDADTMNRNAQNALLKILEEPPENTILILVTHRLGAMIPTIRSRTQTINMAPLDHEHFNALLQKQGYDLSSEQYDTLYNLSEGSIGRALEHIENGGLDTLALMLAMFENFPKWSWPDIHTMADQLGRNGRNHSYNTFAELLPWMFKEMIRSKAKGKELGVQILQQNAIQALHKQSSLESLLKICENLESHFETVQRANLDKRQAVINAFGMITH